MTISRPRTLRFLHCVMVGVGALVAPGLHVGCHHLSHQTQQVEAQQAWNQLRARYKAQLASQQFRQGHTREAVSTLHEVLALDPNNPVYHRLLAHAYLESGDLASARDATDRAKRIGDTSAELAYTQGIIAERQSRYDQALHYYREAAGLESANVDYLLAVAECLVTLGRAGEAKSFLDEQLGRLEGQEQLLLLRAQVCVLLNDLSMAAADFEVASNIVLETPWAAEEYGLVLLRLGRHAEAMAILQPLVDSPGRPPSGNGSKGTVSPAVIRALATCYNRTRAPRSAEALLKNHLRHSSGDVRSWWLLAETYVQLEDWAGVRKCIQRGASLAPESSDWKLLRAYLAWHDGDVVTAGRLLQSILNEESSHVLAHFFLDLIEEARSDPGPARDHYESVLQVLRHNPG